MFLPNKNCTNVSVLPFCDWACRVHVDAPLCDGKQKVMGHHTVRNTWWWHRNIRRQEPTDGEQQGLPMPPLPGRQICHQDRGVIKMWWLKANVRSYVELSSAVREDHCHRCDSTKDRANGRDGEGTEDSQGSVTDHKKRPCWQVKVVKWWKAEDIFNVGMSLRHWESIMDEARVVTGWRLQHVNFKLHWSTLLAEGMGLLITVIAHQTKTEWSPVTRSLSPNGLPTSPRIQ